MLLLTISFTLLFLPKFSAGGKCREDWTEIDEKCIKLFEHKVSWLTARKSCEASHGGHLAILTTDELNNTTKFFEKAKLTDKLKDHLLMPESKYIWIGLARLCPGGDDDSKFKWLDGNKAEDKNPVTRSGKTDDFCVGLTNDDLTADKLKSFPCEDKNMFLCQTEEMKTKDDQCPIGFCKGKHFPKSCYSMTPFKSTWHTAEAYCKSQGGNLISIVDKEENDELREYVKKMNIKYHWIGLNSPLGHKFRWSDSSPLQFVVSWSSDATVPLNESCVAAYHSSGITRWMKMPCDEKIEGICKKAEKRPKAEEGKSKSENKFCKEGWKQYIDWCYQITKEDKNAKDFPDSCPTDSTPAAIRDPYHEQFLLGSMKADGAWFDLRQDKDGSRHYHSSVEKTISYSNVDELHTCQTTNEFCPFYLTTVGWRAESNKDIQRKTICEMEPGETEDKGASDSCTNGTSFKSSCYVLEDMSNWDEANKTGCGKNGTLVLLTDDAEWRFVSTFVHKNWIRSFWIGRKLGDKNTEADYMKKNEFKQEVQENRNDQCHEMVLGESGPRVVLADCRDQLPFVCKYPSATGAKTTTTTTAATLPPKSGGKKGKSTKKPGTTVKPPPTEIPRNNGTEAGQSAGGSNATLKNAVIAMSVLLVLGLVIGVVCWLRRRKRRPHHRMDSPIVFSSDDQDFDQSMS